MAQVLLLGLGGTGSRVVNHVAQEMRQKHIGINNGKVCCAVLDTNKNDQDKLSASDIDIPVIAMSKERSIRDYMKIYANRGIASWMPTSPEIMKESMLDGASQMRAKSRLAFMDMVEDSSIHELEEYIEKLFANRQEAKIRVMLVSSLAGGTGSGMFIQVALWLRKFFAKHNVKSITIRGILILPDVFVDTLKDFREDPTEKLSIYANAYAAVRELNAISKCKAKGIKPLHPIQIDSLFDSEDEPDGQPVFDYSFFIDNIAEDGSTLKDLDAYEKLAARLIYMQLFAPMHDDMNSEEDNLFKRFQKSPEPVFGSCGTAKAIYPSTDILNYCAMRAAQDSVSLGWQKIDEEIKKKQRKEDEKEKNGAVLTSRIDPRVEYVRLYEAKTAKSAKEAGKDRLFVDLAKDASNETRVKSNDGTIISEFTPKIDDYVKELESVVAAKVDTSDVGMLSGLTLSETWLKQTTDNKASLLKLVDKKERDVKSCLEDVDFNATNLAEELIEELCPTDIGDVNFNNPMSLLGLLTKLDENAERYFIHPISIRYLIYKLIGRLEETKNAITLKSSRDCAEKGYGDGKARINFDNRATGAIEQTPSQYLLSRAFLQGEAGFIKNFKKKYSQHIKGQYELCRAYAIASVTFYLLIEFVKRLEAIAEMLENFFERLTVVANTLEDEIAKNLRKNGEGMQKVVYICASPEEKESLYQSLKFGTDKSDHNINATIANAIYAQFCVEQNPEAYNNKPYSGRSVLEIFFKEILNTYKEIILSKNKDDIDLDIYSAVCKAADIELEKKASKQKKADLEAERLIVDETGDVVDQTADKRLAAHEDAMKDLVDKLYKMASHFVTSTDELPEDDGEWEDDEDADVVFTPIKKRKTFWGFHPAVVEKCENLSQILGINAEQQKNIAYYKNEFDCYRAVYGIQAGYIEKFNELSPKGEYYTSYLQTVNEMVEKVSDGDVYALVQTPHIDKTWHRYLPYITPEKCEEEESLFYRRFWLALAYGMITLGNSGRYQIARTKKTKMGAYEQVEPLRYEGRTITKVEIDKLLKALRVDDSFMIDSADLERVFEEETAKVDNYEGTKLLRGEVIKAGEISADTEENTKYTVGGLATKRDTNAVTMIVRYQNLPTHSNDVTAILIQSLEALFTDLVAAKYEVGEQGKIKNRAYELCKRVYTASAMKDKDISLIAHWKKAWSATSIEE